MLDSTGSLPGEESTEESQASHLPPILTWPGPWVITPKVQLVVSHGEPEGFGRGWQA